MIEQQGHVFIDPKTCGSSIGYYITTGEYTPKNGKTEYSVSATVVLADCNHKVDWSFEAIDIDKVDAAIKMLNEFRKKLIETGKLVAKLNNK